MAFVQAYTTQVVVIEAKENEHAEISMLLYALNSLNVQVFVKAGAGASIDIVEVLASSDTSKESGLINSIVASKGAKVNINVLHNECGNAKVLNFYNGEADEISSISINSMFAGGLLTKSKSMLSAKGIDSSVSISELVIASDSQGFDINSNVFNSGKASHSSIDSKAIAMGKALCMLKGRAEIAYNSSASDSVIAERGLIMGADAKIETIPSMEVLENDVRASHSSAIAPIDITSTEYLMSRGISKEAAYAMLALGIINGLITKFNNKFVEVIYSIARQRLNGSKIGAIMDLKTAEHFMHNTTEELGT
jgi:Fe-S cluster assembly scaffold protein SufB